MCIAENKNKDKKNNATKTRNDDGPMTEWMNTPHIPDAVRCTEYGSNKTGNEKRKENQEKEMKKRKKIDRSQKKVKF